VWPSASHVTSANPILIREYAYAGSAAQRLMPSYGARRHPCQKCSFGAHFDAARRTERNDACLVKIAVIATEHIGFPPLGGLHHIKVIGVAQRSVIRLFDYNRLADILKELRVAVEFVFRERMQFLQSRIAEHLDRLDNDFV
jgi:hypothetical protein